MKFVALAFLGVLTVAACEQRQGEETGRAVDAADTIVTSEENLDTTVITRDTTIDVDTVRHEGDQPVGEDTLQQPGGADAPSADTGSVDATQQ